MAEKVITKISFVGEGHAGRLAYPGEIVDVDAKTGQPIAAGSTPIGNMTVEQLRSYLNNREAEAPDEEFGENVEEPSKTNVGSQPLVMAPIRPGSGPTPQGLPPGTVPAGDRFIRPAPEGSSAAVEEIVGTATVEGGVRTDVPIDQQTDSAFDHDHDGAVGGSEADSPVSLSGKNKADLLSIADAEGVTVEDGATNAQIVEAIEAKRAG